MFGLNTDENLELTIKDIALGGDGFFIVEDFMNIFSARRSEMLNSS